MGDVGLIKVVSEFSSGHPKCHFSMGTFGKSAHLYVPKNSTSDARTKILRPTSPKNDGIAFHFKRLRLLGWVTSPFLNIVIFYQFWALFPLARTPTQNGGAIGQILRYMSEIFFGASCDGGTRCPSWHKLKSNFQYIGTSY